MTGWKYASPSPPPPLMAPWVLELSELLAIGMVAAHENLASPSIAICWLLAHKTVFMSNSTACCPVASTSPFPPTCSSRA
jgi:hypothetical protein